MYEKFFGLKTKPFELVPNPDFLYFSRPHKKAIMYLDYGIKEKAGFILLTGEVGCGKTTLIKNLIKRLNGNVNLSLVFNTKVTSEQLIAMINQDFGLIAAGKDRVTMLRELNEFLIDQYANNVQPILIIDEAQNLSQELLEEVRMLSNLETERYKLLQIILVGQPELRKTLALPEMRQLRQRISISCTIRPLTKDETREYIFHRLEIAGNRDAISFHEGTMDVIYNFSRGIPRLINIICDFLMLSAFVDEKKELTTEMVKEVIGEIETENRYWEDDISVRSFSENESHLKEIVNRINSIEDALFKGSINQTEKTEILERLAVMEKLISVSKIDFESESINNVFVELKSEINNLTNEISLLKSKISELESDKNMASAPSNGDKTGQHENTGKKGIFRRIFG